MGEGFHNVWTTCWYILVPAPPPPTPLVLSLPLPPLIPLTHHSSSLAPASLSLSLFPSSRITVFFNEPLCFSLAPPLFLSALRRSFSLSLPVPSLPLSLPPPSTSPTSKNSAAASWTRPSCFKDLFDVGPVPAPSFPAAAQVGERPAK